MPCDCSHLEPTHVELEMSKVACLMDELAGKEIDKWHWRGNHPRVYNKDVDADAMTAELCSRLQEVDVSDYSLEMQMWWRDHKAADKRRAEEAVAKAKTDKQRAEALQKLTPHERNLLGLK